MADSQTPDGFVFQVDGTVTIALDDGTRTLRRPKVGELRRLKERYTTARRKRDDLLAALTERGAAFKLEAEGLPLDDQAAEERREAIKVEERALADETVRAAEDLWLAWMRFAFDGGDHFGEHVPGLADKPLPDDDDLPAWFISEKPIGALLNHWQTAPPLRGAR